MHLRNEGILGLRAEADAPLLRRTGYAVTHIAESTALPPATAPTTPVLTDLCSGYPRGW